MNEADHEEENVSEEFIFGQLLLMAEYQDYSDEMGRREMAAVLKEMLIMLDLPDEVLESCIRTMKNVSGNEDEFLR